MKLHTVFVTYNRLELTKQAIESYLDTVTVPFAMSIVDNGSTDGTQEWLWNNESLLNALGPRLHYHFFQSNKYPGKATNTAWEMSTPDDATHLHRADNDFAFLPGWCDEVEAHFQENEKLGQLGLRTGEEELWNTHNVGGNCVIRRELWDQGLRWDERPWPEIKTPGYTEDSFFSPEVERMGWTWARVEKPCIRSLSFEDPEDPYYRKTWADRGINL
jgi:glycosyltransferase involved in cell wall biosynthesis